MKAAILLLLVNLLFYSVPALAAAEPGKQNPDKKHIRKLNGDLQAARKKHNLEEIDRLIDAGASPNGYVALGSMLDFRSYPLCDALRDDDSKSVAVVELLVRKGADLEFMGQNYNVLNCLLKSRVQYKREKLSILLRNGIKIDLNDVLARLNRQYRVRYGVEPDTKTPWQKERDDLELLVRDELERRAQRKHLLLAEIQIFVPPLALADIVAEYRGHLGIKTAQDLQEEQRELAEQQQKQQLQQKSKQAGKIIWV